jgi:hypothetical protein
VVGDIVLTTFDEDEYVAEALRIGIRTRVQAVVYAYRNGIAGR